MRTTPVWPLERHAGASITAASFDVGVSTLSCTEATILEGPHGMGMATVRWARSVALAIVSVLDSPACSPSRFAPQFIAGLLQGTECKSNR